MTTKTTTVLDARAVERTLKRMSVEIVELNRGTDDLIIVGIQRRGVQLADRAQLTAREVDRCRDRRRAADLWLLLERGDAFAQELKLLRHGIVAGLGIRAEILRARACGEHDRNQTDCFEHSDGTVRVRRARRPVATRA